MDGDGGSGPGVVDSHSKLGGGEGTAAWVAKACAWRGTGRRRRILDLLPQPPKSPPNTFCPSGSQVNPVFVYA